MSDDRPDSHSERRYEPSLDEAVRAAYVATPDHLDHLEDDEVATYYLAKIASHHHERDQQLQTLYNLAKVGLLTYGFCALVDRLQNTGRLTLR